MNIKELKSLCKLGSTLGIYSLVELVNMMKEGVNADFITSIGFKDSFGASFTIVKNKKVMKTLNIK